MLLVAPDARSTEATLNVDASKLEELLSLFARLKVSVAQPVSLLVIVSV